ncbi:MAG: LysR family transcriptional regulator [Clostridiales bacterium]|nr:LysR family transcriptional regulator [Clostridiales bacterium]
MEIRNLITFTKVAEAQSLSGAAKQLGYAQSTVTMQMQQLEQEIGAPLYERVGKRIRITQAGEALLRYAVPIIQLSEEALSVGQNEVRAPEGELRIGVAEACRDERFTRSLAEFAGAYPQVHVEVCGGRGADELNYQLMHNEIDLMMTVGEYLDDSAFVHAWEEEERLVIVGAKELQGAQRLPGMRESQRARENPGAQEIREARDDALQFRGCPWIYSGFGVEETRFERWLRGTGEGDVAERKIIRVSDLRLALELAVRGSGFTLAPEQMAIPWLRQGKLQIFDCSWPGGKVWRQIMYHRNKWKTAAMDAWIKMWEQNKEQKEKRGV